MKIMLVSGPETIVLGPEPAVWVPKRRFPDLETVVSRAKITVAGSEIAIFLISNHIFDFEMQNRPEFLDDQMSGCLDAWR